VRGRGPTGRTQVAFSGDNGRTWSEPVDAPESLWGDGHRAVRTADGRLVVVFRDSLPDRPTRGDLLAWVGTLADLRDGRPGHYRLKLRAADSAAHHSAACDLRLMPDGLIVATACPAAGERGWSTGFRLRDTDVLAGAEAFRSLPEASPAPPRDLSRFFAKIAAGTPVVVMGIGGSVTEGRSWAALATEGLRERHPGKPITYVTGAYGGTPPWQTVFRLRRDILPHAPDLVFIEYSVNSYLDNRRNWLAEDGIVRQLLRLPNKPDIVFVYVGDQRGYRDLSKVQPVARHYGFPEIDVYAHLRGKLDAGAVAWSDFARDAIHPTLRGHAIYAEAVIALLEREAARAADAAVPAADFPLPEPYCGDEFTTATLLPIAAARASAGWRTIRPPGASARFFDEMLEAAAPGETLSVTADTTALGLYLVQSTDSGRIAWSIDGGPEQIEDLWAPWLSAGNHFARVFLLAYDLPRGTHELRVTVLPKGENSTGNLVRIGGFCVTNPRP